jgi:hypothetical protein
MRKIPDAAVIEIVEKAPEPPAHGVIVPNDVRINGTSVLLPDLADYPITVHELKIGGGEAEVVLVTLTLFAKRVTIGHEETPA